MLTRRPPVWILILLLIPIFLAGLLGVLVWATLFHQKTVDLSDGIRIEHLLVREFKESGTELASFAALRDWSQGSWTHYCVLDYSTTERIVENYAEAHRLKLGSVELEGIFFARPGLWSIILMSEGRYRQVIMPGHQIALRPDSIIGSCSPIDGAIFQLDFQLDKSGSGSHFSLYQRRP